MKIAQGLFAAALLAAALPSVADAQTLPSAPAYTVTTFDRGYTGTQEDKGPNGTGNYLAGNFPTDSGELRNYFNFSIPTFTGVVTKAQIILGAGTITTDQSSTIDYTLTSTASYHFASYGTGTVYGTGTFSSDQTNTNLVFDLDSAALAAITSGSTFVVSGRVTSPTVFSTSAPDQNLFGFTGGNTMSRLIFETTPFAVGVPEPATWALTILGFGAAGVAMRRRRATLRIARAA